MRRRLSLKKRLRLEEDRLSRRQIAIIKRLGKDAFFVPSGKKKA